MACAEPQGVCQETPLVCPANEECYVETGNCVPIVLFPNPESIVSNCWLQYKERGWLGETWLFVKIQVDVTVLPPNSAKFVSIDWDFDFIRFYIIESEYVMFGYKTDEADDQTIALPFESPPMEITLWDDFDHIDEYYTTSNGKLWEILIYTTRPVHGIPWAAIIQRSLISFTSIERHNCNISSLQWPNRVAASKCKNSFLNLY